MQATPAKQYQTNHLLYKLCTIGLGVGMHAFYDICYEGKEHIPPCGPALILAKHQYMKDIPLEGLFLYEACGRTGNWIMKSSLPRMLGMIGGIPVGRSTDVRKGGRKALAEAKGLNEYAHLRVSQMYNQGELVVVHPEGTRMPGTVGKIRSTYIDAAIKAGVSIPIVPLGIEYSIGRALRPQAIVRAGPALDVHTPSVETVVSTELKRLSGIA